MSMQGDDGNINRDTDSSARPSKKAKAATTATTTMATTTPAPHHVAKLYDAKQGIGLDRYRRLHKESIERPEAFWGKAGNEHLEWFRPFDSVLNGSFEHGDVRWFEGGKLNVCHNALDRHVRSNAAANDLAIIWEGDEPTDVRRLTYAEALRKVCQISNALLRTGVRRGDVVTIYMPMVPELALTMLACARIGAVHSVVFAGFSAEALAQRVSAAQSRFVVTADVGRRGGKAIPLKDIVNDSLTRLDCDAVVEHVLVWERFYAGADSDPPYEMRPRDVRMDPLVAAQRPYCPPVPMDSEDIL